MELFQRQWERFSLVHEEIMLFASRDTSTVSSATCVYNEQFARKTKLLEKVHNYLQAESIHVNGITLMDDLETRSNATISSFNSKQSARSLASSKSLEKRLKREKAELCLKQLRDRQNLEKNAELRKLEFRLVLEQQKLNHEIEIAKLEERFAAEEERRLYVEEKLYNPSDLIKGSEAFESNYADFNTINKARKFEHPSGSPDAVETKGFRFDELRPEVNDNPAINTANRAVSTNSMEQLAEAIANLSHTPIVEVTKFTGDPKDYLRFVTRFRDQVLLQPIQESKKLSRLIQYLDGKAKEAVERYEGMGPGSLVEALSVLKTRFGQPYMIVDAFIRSIVKGPIIGIGDGKGLQKLADNCQTVLKSLRSMKSFNEINTDHMRKIIGRLPYYNQSRWRDRASEILRKKGSPPDFQDLATFLQERAQSENNPFYGNLKVPDRDNANRTTKVEKRKDELISSFITQFGSGRSGPAAGKRTTVCPVCQGSHALQECNKFLHMPTVLRRKVVLDSKLCFQCLSVGHFKRFCKGNKCQIRGCDKRHHELLHLVSTKEQESNTHQMEFKATEVTKCDANVQTNAASVLPHIYRGATALPVVAVKVHGAKGLETTTYALLDQASEASFIHASLAKRLNLKGSKGVLSVKSLTGTSSIQAEKVNVILESANPANHSSSLLARDVIVTDNLDIQLKVAPTNNDVRSWKHLSDINFPAVELENILVLIGADNPEMFITEEIRTGGVEEPWGFKYKLGWALMGTTNQFQTNQVDVHLLQSSAHDLEDIFLNNQVDRFFYEDGLGVITSVKKTMSVEDKKAEMMLEDSAVLIDGHYQIGMLWKADNLQLPNNRNVALKRFQSLKSRLKKDDELHRKYQTQIEEYVKKGYASKLSLKDMRSTSQRTWYLPHHAVFHPAKPGKVRVVFDAAAKFQNTSLNDNLLHGPNLANEIIEVLLRFRKENVAITADVQEMFHQIKVPEEDRDSLRFLWSPIDNDYPEEYHMNVHIFGAKDSPSIANYTMKRIARDNTNDFSETAVNSVEKDFYVDDLLKSLPTDIEAMQLANELMQLLRRGGFRLTKWMSSSKRVLASIPKSERADPTLNLDLDKLPIERALGLRWNVEEDLFEFKVIDVDKPDTKRGILSTIASLYDPLGFAAPVTLFAKLLLQKLWQRNAEWDEQLSKTELEEWLLWKKALPTLAEVKIPRCYKIGVASDKIVENDDINCVKEVQLHNFSDASDVGYGTASYIRTEFIDGTVVIALVFGKSRTAPLRRISTPGLELQAAVLSVRISEIIQHEIEVTFSKIYYWTDSEVVLKYIQNEDKRFTVYVGNRIAEIREKSEVRQWRYCPSKDNPSDDASRGLKPTEVTSDCRWLIGPSFLMSPE